MGVFRQTAVSGQCKKTANPQMAHLVFADTRANPKTKRAIFCQRTDKTVENFLITFYLAK